MAAGRSGPALARAPACSLLRMRGPPPESFRAAGVSSSTSPVRIHSVLQRASASSRARRWVAHARHERGPSGNKAKVMPSPGRRPSLLRPCRQKRAKDGRDRLIPRDRGPRRIDTERGRRCRAVSDGAPVFERTGGRPASPALRLTASAARYRTHRAKRHSPPRGDRDYRRGFRALSATGSRWHRRCLLPMRNGDDLATRFAADDHRGVDGSRIDGDVQGRWSCEGSRGLRGMWCRVFWPPV